MEEQERLKIFDEMLKEQVGMDKAQLKKFKKKLSEKGEKKPSRGVETWFRLASKNLYTRLTIIDTKSNILITANAIIISVVLGSVYPKVDQDPHLIYAVIGLIVTNILSITFAILATIPNSWKKQDKITNLASADLMTFEEFSGMEVSDYRRCVVNMLDDDGLLYSSMITDIHMLGVRLARKYKLIRISYLIFLYGVIISVLHFSICHYLHI